MKRIASYGSLRKGFWNHARFGLGEPIAITTIKGSMFMNKAMGYPWLFNEKDSKAHNYQIKDYTVEIFDIPEKIFDQINWMEIASGYKEEIVTFHTQNPNDKDYVTLTDATVWFTDPKQIKPSPNQFIEEYKQI